MVCGQPARTYNEYEPQFLYRRPFDRMLIVLVWWVIRSGHVLSGPSSWQTALFDENIRDEAVNDRWADRGVGLGP